MIFRLGKFLVSRTFRPSPNHGIFFTRNMSETTEQQNSMLSNALRSSEVFEEEQLTLTGLPTVVHSLEPERGLSQGLRTRLFLSGVMSSREDWVTWKSQDSDLREKGSRGTHSWQSSLLMNASRPTRLGSCSQLSIQQIRLLIFFQSGRS